MQESDWVTNSKIIYVEDITVIIKKKRCIIKKIIKLVLFIFIAHNLFGHQLSKVMQEEINNLARNWVAYINLIPLEGRDCEYQLKSVESILYNGNILCSVYHLSPQGNIVIPHYREFLPVKSFSVISNFDSNSMGYEYVIQEELKNTFDFLQDYILGESEGLDKVIKSNSSQWDNLVSVNFDRSHLHALQQDWEAGKKTLIIQDFLDNKIESNSAGPLLNTKWGQDSPYWNLCPLWYLNRCYVGCTATAMAQIMRFYKWPKKGEGSHSYFWTNGGYSLSASFDDEYDWDFMPFETWEIDKDREKNAVAELCYEAGVSVNMEYGIEGSSAYVSEVATALNKYFKYSKKIKVVYRNNYDDVNQWFNVFKNQRDLGRPVEFAIYGSSEGHAVVVDGYLVTGDIKKVHINLGWNGYYDAYYTLDGILDFTNLYYQHAVIDIIPEKKDIELDKTSITFNAVEGQANPPSQNFRVRNLGLGIMNYLISSPESWIDVYPEYSSNQGEWDIITVYVYTSNLLEGAHHGTVEVSSEDAENSPQKLDVTLNLAPPPIYAPINLSGKRFENRSLSQVEYIHVLKWSPNPQNRHIEKYRIFRVSGDIFQLLKTVSINENEYLVRRVQKDKTYVYAIKAVDYKDREGPPGYIMIQQ